MQGAREYNTALEACAANNVCGFRKFWRSRRDFIVNGHFVFETGEHARGKTLTVYMTDTPLVDKMETAEREEIFKRGLKVYDVVSGQRGWDERYGFVVHGIIEKTVQDMLNAAVHAHANMVACLELRKKQKKRKRQGCIVKKSSGSKTSSNMVTKLIQTVLLKAHPKKTMFLMVDILFLRLEILKKKNLKPSRNIYAVIENWAFPNMTEQNIYGHMRIFTKLALKIKGRKTVIFSIASKRGSIIFPAKMSFLSM